MQEVRRGAPPSPSLFVSGGNTMNTIGMIGKVLATDGQTAGSALAKQNISENKLPDSAAEVTKNISQNLEETEANVRELQKLSDMLMGHKLQFNVNEELGRVIVKVVNPSTNEIIREIPSEDVQKFQAHMKKTVGLLFDEMI